jgi:hypothetical protein
MVLGPIWECVVPSNFRKVIIVATDLLRSPAGTTALRSMTMVLNGI